MAGQGYKAAPCNYQFIPAVVGGRGLNFQKTINCSSGTCFSNEYAKQNANQQLSEIIEQVKLARLGFTGAIVKAETQRQGRDCEMTKIRINTT